MGNDLFLNFLKVNFKLIVVFLFLTQSYSFADPVTVINQEINPQHIDQEEASDEDSEDVDETNLMNYSINSAVQGNGSILPSGIVAVLETSDQVFNITPDPQFHIKDVLVNGVSVGAVNSYEFSDIQSDATITAIFEANAPPTNSKHSITVVNSHNGSINPSGIVLVDDGATQTFSISPDVGYHVKDVQVNGASVGPINSYKLTSVNADVSISAIFEADTPDYRGYSRVISNESSNQNTNIGVTSNESSKYIVNAIALEHGAISPSGTIAVEPGSSLSFSISADNGYSIKKIVVNGNSFEPSAIYQLSNISSDTNIIVYFEVNSQINTPTFVLTAAASEHGYISPLGALTVSQGSNQTYVISPSTGYHINDVLVDGVSVGAVESYTFSNVTADHAISASFALNPPNTHTITTNLGINGTISPNGVISVVEGGNQTFTITADANYHVADVLVDGVSVGAVSSYNFNNITADHTINVIFALTPPNTHTIIASVGTNGTISPNGATSIVDGNNQVYTITADSNYHIADVLVDGVSVGAVGSYTFINVSADHTISASFASNTRTIVTSLSGNGSISPSGNVSINPGENQIFQITPALNYHIADVLVDGVSVGAVSTYTFNHVVIDHTISVSFVIDTHTVIASAGDNGAIIPEGMVAVNHSANQLFTFTPDAGYKVGSVIVDQMPVTVTNNTFTISNVVSNHIIAVNFIPLANSNNNFTFIFDPNTTLLKELNWRNSNGVNKRIVWDEVARFEPDHHSPSWINIYLHSMTATNPNYFHNSWCYNTLDNNPANCLALTHGDLNYQFLSPPTSDRVQIQAVSTGMMVQDDFSFVGDSIYLNVTLTNTLASEMKRVEVPIYLGALVIGNFDTDIRKIKVCAFGSNGACSNPNDGPGLARLRNIKSGTIEERFENPAGSSWDMYPGGYSPIAVLWGAAKFNVDNTNVNCSNPIDCDSLTIGAQFLTNVSFPSSIGFQEIPFNSHSPMLNAKIITSLLPGESKTYNLVYKMVDGYGNWENALQLYKDWFNFEYGSLNEQSQNYEPTPQYCPTEPFHYMVGSNAGPGFYDRNTKRYLPNTTLHNLFGVDALLPKLQQSGIKRFGIWQTAINAELIGGYEFDPNISLIDPNIDAGPDRSKINNFTSTFAQNNVDIFWFARPCRYLEGASIDYNVSPPLITSGTWEDSVDLRTPVNRDRYFNDMKSFVDRGVKGFYFDEGNFCPGFEGFLKYVKDEFKRQNNVDLFLLQEGSIDRNSILSPQIPVLKLPYYDWHSSVLLNYLVPDATYYGGAINASLSEEELDDVLSKGYQAISGTVLTSRFCHVLRTSHENQVAKWQHYGQRIGCPMPDTVSEACLNYPDKYFTVNITSNAGGSVSPTGVLSNVLEGWNFNMTITADPGYHISRIAFLHNGLGTFELHPSGNISSYSMLSPAIYDNANFDITFEAN